MFKRIICAGGYRSGSTWQYNVVREIFEASNIEYICGDAAQIKFDGSFNEIIKSHNYRPNFLEDAIVLTTNRDIRDIAASAVRRRMSNVCDNSGPNLNKTIIFLKSVIELIIFPTGINSFSYRYNNDFDDQKQYVF
jgi:hypothetical protein